MSANILVVEYEPRYVEHVRAALADSGFRLEIAGNLDDAVNRCAHFEPTMVIITSVLPNLKVEDAITQLRARAGLRATPILILMSGYRGDSPREDAVRYGAQDILQRPFGRDDLRARVEQLLADAPNPAATQAIPQEMLEALRRSAGLDGGEGSVTSDDLFGDIVFDVEGADAPASSPVEDVMPSGEPPPRKPEDEKPPPRSSSVDEALADILASTKSSSVPRRERDVSADVDKILSETLSGLEVGRKKPVGERSAKAGPEDGPDRKPAAPAAATDGAEAAPTPPPAPPERRTGKAAPPSASAAAKSTSAAGAPAGSGTPPAQPPKTSPPPSATPAPGRDPGSGAGGAREEAPKVPAAREATVGGTQFGQYVIEEHIATGGMAEVYKARMMGMEGFQKTVAIKRILSNLTDSDEFVRMFIDEAKLAAQLNHNNIIHIYDLGKVDRSHYIAMEFIEGRDLRSILGDFVERGVAIPIPVALHIASLLASALDYAHKKRDFENRELGLVHRDVSPQNVLISHEGDVKLCDFGIAKAASKVSQTRAGALKGKLQYMSPEQAWGKSIDHRSDIFSLGLVLYEMLTSQKVFSGDSELSVLEQVRDPIIAAPSSHNPEIGPEIDRIVFKALCADREDRYQSALDLQRDLEQVMRSKGWTVDHSAVAGLLSGLGRERSTPAKPTATAAPAESAGGPPAPPTKRPSRRSGSAPQGPAIAPPAAKARKTSQLSGQLDGAGPDAELERALGGGGGGGASGGPAVLSELSDSGISHRSRLRKPPWLLIAGVAMAVAAAGAVGWLIFGGDGSGSQPPPRVEPPVATATETPVAEPGAGLLTEEELIEQARVVAAAEIEKQEEALRQRLEQEFPTPTPYPPTRTPSPTATPAPTATWTPTRVPPTATRVPTSTPVPPTATPAVREGDIVTLGPGVTPPVAIQQDSPDYPRVALRMAQTGLVQAEVLVGIDGRVEEFRVITVDPQGFGFETATEEAARTWRYRPATKHGVRVRMWVSVRVPFRGGS